MGKILFNAVIGGSILIIILKGQNRKDVVNELIALGTFILGLALIITIYYSDLSLMHSIANLHIKQSNFEEALEKMEKENAILLDARAKSRYDEEHVPGALSLPAVEFREYYPRYKRLLDSKKVFIYCDGSDCTASKRLALKLVQRGITEIHTINENLVEWKSRKQKISYRATSIK